MSSRMNSISCVSHYLICSVNSKSRKRAFNFRTRQRQRIRKDIGWSSVWTWNRFYWLTWPISITIWSNRFSCVETWWWRTAFHLNFSTNPDPRHMPPKPMVLNALECGRYLVNYRTRWTRVIRGTRSTISSWFLIHHRAQRSRAKFVFKRRVNRHEVMVTMRIHWRMSHRRTPTDRCLREIMSPLYPPSMSRRFLRPHLIDTTMVYISLFVHNRWPRLIPFTRIPVTNSPLAQTVRNGTPICPIRFFVYVRWSDWARVRAGAEIFSGLKMVSMRSIHRMRSSFRCMSKLNNNGSSSDIRIKSVPSPWMAILRS